MPEVMQTLGCRPEQFIKTVASLYRPGQLGEGLPPTTDQILQVLSKGDREHTLTIPQKELYDNLSHLTFGTNFRALLESRIQQGRSWAVNVCCPTMPRDSLSQDSTLSLIGSKVAYAAKRLQEEYSQIPNFPTVPESQKRVAVLMSIYATPNYPGKDFADYAQSESSLKAERERLQQYTHPELAGSSIGKLEFVYPNHKGFFELWDKLGLSDLKKSGKGTAMFVASLAVLARQNAAQIPDRNGFFFAMDTDLKVPSSAYLAGFMNSALQDYVASIASFFRINPSGIETGRLNAVMTPFMRALDEVLGEKLGPNFKNLMAVIMQINYKLSGERQFRTDLLKDIPIGGGYFYETSVNLDLSEKVVSPNHTLRASDIANVLIGTYAHHNQAANEAELVAKGTPAGRTLKDMAKEIIGGFFKAVVAEMGYQGIQEAWIDDVVKLTRSYGSIMIREKSELAREVGLQPPNKEALLDLLDYSCSTITTEFYEVTRALRSGELSPSKRMTLNDILRNADSRELFAEVNNILDDSNRGISPNDLRPFV